MRPRPRAPRAYPRFLPCRIVHRRGRACVPCTSTPRRPATQSPAARPTHQPRAALPSRGAGAAPRGAPGASALASSARVRRPELVPVRRPTGVGRPGSWVWAGVRVRAVRAWCAPARAATCPIRLHRRRPPTDIVLVIVARSTPASVQLTTALNDSISANCSEVFENTNLLRFIKCVST